MIEQLHHDIEARSVKEKDSSDEEVTQEGIIRPSETIEAQDAVTMSELEADVERAYETVEVLPGVMIERRKPVVGDQNIETVENPLVSREWTLITEVIKRKLSQPEARTALKSFINTPVSQHLASDMLDVLKQDAEVGSVLKRSGTHLADMLVLKEVPEEVMNPDVRNARLLADPLEYIAGLRSDDRSDERIETLVKEYSEKGSYINGLSPHEKSLVLKKYAFARDVKLLALGAELTEVGEIDLNDSGEGLLPSGTRLKVSSEHLQSPGFLDPSKWEYRRQFKDRVYEIGVDGKKYFLKERKTSRHRDTMPNGHREGLTSAEEYELAGLLNAQASVTEGEVRVSWEKPVGFVEYPDGFSFAVFEYEEGIIADDAPIREVGEAIRHNPEAYQSEYEEVKNRISAYLNNPLVKDAAAAGGIKLPRRFGFFGKHESTLDYEMFAEAKAHFLCRKARETMEDKALDLGYQNIDATDTKFAGAYRLGEEEGKAIVEVVGFDYELYRKYDPNQTARIREADEGLRQYKPWKSLPFGFRDKPVQLAAYLAMRELDESAHSSAVAGR